MLDDALARMLSFQIAREPAIAMKFEDALRKIRLLRQVKPENGSSEAEAESAAALVRTLMERFAVKPEETRPANGPLFRMSWVYWDHLLAEFGLELEHFGKRGSARIGQDKKALIRLDTGEWRIQRTTLTGTEELFKDTGVESFQSYLNKNAPRMYSLSGNRRNIFRAR
jgi:hypothetical protein